MEWRGMKSTWTIGAVSYFLAPALALGQGAVRELPPIFGGPITSVQVQITITPPAGTAAMGLEDLPPAGWAVSNISNGGAVDQQTGKVKWGPFFGTIPGLLSYELSVPVPSSGPVCFTGTVSFDGLDQPLTGDRCIDGPIPAASEWGLGVLGLCTLICGTVLLRKRENDRRLAD